MVPGMEGYCISVTPRGMLAGAADWKFVGQRTCLHLPALRVSTLRGYKPGADAPEAFKVQATPTGWTERSLNLIGRGLKLLF